MINIPRGTKDVLPFDSYKWQYIEQTARDLCSLFHVKEIRTPVFEHTELFDRSIGEQTDVVSKEMYTFSDKGNRSLTLKPEGTAPVARSYIENGLEAMSLPLKMYYFSPVYRYERPAAGRLREHHQFGIEYYGGEGAAVDFEVICLARQFFRFLGIESLSLRINSLGCPDCRKVYIGQLKAYLSSKISDMCGTCRERFEKNPLRILDCKVEGCKAIVADAPKITDYLCADCSKNFGQVQKHLSDANIDFAVDPGIVRGLDYYNRTVFEFVSGTAGMQGTVCGGGRYDHLVQSLGGKPTPCVGFGLGLERLLLLMEAQNIAIPDTGNPDFFIAYQSEGQFSAAMRLANRLRGAGKKVEMDLTGRSLKAQMKFANKVQARYAVVIGEQELTVGETSVKRMADGQSFHCKLDELENFKGE